MSSRIKNYKGLPPRALLRYKDCLTGSYPLIARTGDERRGKLIQPYLDNNSIIFNSSAGSTSNNDATANSFRAPIEDLTAGNGNFYKDSSDLLAHYRFENSIIDSAGINSGGDFLDDFAGSSVSPIYTGKTAFPGSKAAAVFDGARIFDTNTGSFNFGDGVDDSPFSVMA